MGEAFFASLETRKINTCRLSINQLPNFHDSHRFGLTQNSPNLAKLTLAASVRDTWLQHKHHLQSWGRGHLLLVCDRLEGCLVSVHGHYQPHHHLPCARQTASAFLLRRGAAAAASSQPCCPSIIHIFSPHLLDTCMNEEIDQ